jgi:general secretion pathway protein H
MPIRRQRGFTLLEILVVLALMGMMYALVPPMFSSSGTTELRAAARQLAAGLRKARGQAIASRQEATLTVDVEAHQFRVAGDSRDYPLPKAAKLSVYTAQSEAIEGRQAAIRFYPDGSSTGGAITVARGDTKFRVDVDWLTGNVAILD